MIDCGADWLRRIRRMRPDAVVLTHTHPDHAWGLKKGAPCDVYATEQTLNAIERFSVANRITVTPPREPFRIQGITLEAFSVEHSVRAPAVGYCITAGRRSIFYVPDLVSICDVHEALTGIDLYVGVAPPGNGRLSERKEVNWWATPQSGHNWPGAGRRAYGRHYLRIAARKSWVRKPRLYVELYRSSARLKV